jgi:hypothetical protein
MAESPSTIPVSSQEQQQLILPNSNDPMSQLVQARVQEEVSMLQYQQNMRTTLFDLAERLKSTTSNEERLLLIENINIIRNCLEVPSNQASNENRQGIQIFRGLDAMGHGNQAAVNTGEADAHIFLIENIKTKDAMHTIGSMSDDTVQKRSSHCCGNNACVIEKESVPTQGAINFSSPTSKNRNDKATTLCQKRQDHQSEDSDPKPDRPSPNEVRKRKG